jgi:hypothetical protein
MKPITVHKQMRHGLIVIRVCAANIGAYDNPWLNWIFAGRRATKKD